MHNYSETNGSIKRAKQLDRHPEAAGTKLLSVVLLIPHGHQCGERGSCYPISSAHPSPGACGPAVTLLHLGTFAKYVLVMPALQSE